MIYTEKYQSDRSAVLEKNHWEKSVKLGFCTIIFGSISEMQAESKSRMLMVKMFGKLPKQKGERSTVLMLGFKTIRYGRRMRIGWTSRKQIIEKA